MLTFSSAISIIFLCIIFSSFFTNTIAAVIDTATIATAITTASVISITLLALTRNYIVFTNMKS